MQPHRSSSHTTPPSLLARIRNHDDSRAWETFCDVYSPLLYNYCRKRGLQSSDAADVVQEALLRVTKGILKFEYDPARGRFRDWLYRIVHHELCRFTSRKKPAQEIGDCEAEIAVIEDRQWNENFHDHILKSALERIRPSFEKEKWQAFTLVWLENKPAGDVAEILDVTLNFIYLAKSRVIKRLALEVEQLADEAGLNHGKMP
jgi:RNA polymerase sigma-70 factor (ECF subfamily)